MNRSSIAVLAAVTIALTGVAIWFFTSFERYEDTERVGYQAEARRNPMLAAGMMLRRLGLEASELEADTWLDAIDGRSGTLVLASRSWTLGREDLSRLLAWIEAGGHVVVAPEVRASGLFRGSGDVAPQTDEDGAVRVESAGALLDELDIGQIRISNDATDAQDWDVLTLDFQGQRVKALFPTRYRLVAGSGAQVVRAHDEHGACFLQVAYGRGRVSALCTLRGLTNRWIDEQQNATLMWMLANEDGRVQPTWLLFDTDMPPLYQWLWRTMPFAVLTAAVLLLTWLWSLTRSHGPLADLEPPGNRQTLEHVQASGRFLWRYGGRNALLDSMRHSFHAQLERRHPGWMGEPDAQRFARLAELSAMEPVQVYQALAAEPRDRGQFIAAVRDLQRLREFL